MAAAALQKVTARSAAEVCRNFDLKEEARPLLRDGQTPREFLDALVAEENRQAAKAPADGATLRTPAGGLAMATAWTGGSLAPPMANANPKVPPPPPVPPGPYVPAKVVAGAILLAAVKGDPTRIADTQRTFVELGIGVAEGRFVWPEVPRRKASGTWSRTS